MVRLIAMVLTLKKTPRLDSICENEFFSLSLKGLPCLFFVSKIVFRPQLVKS